MGTRTPTTLSNLAAIYSHYFEVKDLDPNLVENISKKVANKFTTYVGQGSSKFIKDEKGFKIRDTKADLQVYVVPSRNRSILIDGSTTVKDLFNLKPISKEKDDIILRLGYDEYKDTEEGIENIVNKIRMSFMSHLQISSLDNTVDFKLELTKSTQSFKCIMSIRQQPIASIEGQIKYGLKEGMATVNGMMTRTIYPTTRIVINRFNGPQNTNILTYLVSYVDAGLDSNKAMEILNNSNSNRELITLLNKIGSNIDLKDMAKLKKLYNGEKVIDIRLPIKLSPQDKVCVDGTIGNVSTVVTAYEATLDQSLVPLMPKETEELALNAVKNFQVQAPKKANGFIYLSSITQVNLKKAIQEINAATGLDFGNLPGSNLFGFTVNNVALGGTIAPRNAVGNSNDELLMNMLSKLMAGQQTQ